MTGERPRKNNVILCGFMATGKSSVGKCLASLMGYDFMDMDAVIEEEAGMPIPQIFSTRGEPAFRALESDLVERLTHMNGYVIATGGGTIVNPRNLALLKKSGAVISLAADLETILARVGSGEDRPMLKGEDLKKRITVLMNERADIYAQADITLDTSTLSIDQVAQHILISLEQESEK